MSGAEGLDLAAVLRNAIEDLEACMAYDPATSPPGVEERMRELPRRIAGYEEVLRLLEGKREEEKALTLGTPADFLEEIAGIWRERQRQYGSNYRHVGRLMTGLLPDGLVVEPDDEETWNRLHLIFHMISKLTRYAQNLKRGGHRDSLDDLAVYAMIARECDELGIGRKREEGK